MRADERQAAVAYAYAWWMTGDDDDAGTALRVALTTPDPVEEGEPDRLVALMTAVRSHLGDLRTMPPSSELALLHDGFGVPLQAAATLADVPADTAGHALAHGRLEALLETVRENFAHTDRLAGLAVGDTDAVAHAADCPSCGRAVTLIERGRVELRDVSPVSAPPGMIARLVAEAAPEAAAPDTDATQTETATPSVEQLEEMLRAEVAPEAAPPEVAPEAPPHEATPPETAPPEMAPQAPPRRPAATPEPEPVDHVPMSPARKTVLALLSGAGVLTAGALLIFFLSSSPEEAPVAQSPIEEPTSGPTTAPEPTTTPTPDSSSSPFDPPRGRRFDVVRAGLLVAAEDELAPAGVTISPQDPLRIAVDYVNGSKGVELKAVWRTDGEVFERLRTVVSGRASRHVWGLPVPPDGWPVGQARIAVTANDGEAGSIDFTVSQPE